MNQEAIPEPQCDADRFLALVQSHHRALWKVCWAYTKNAHDRDDLLQEIIGQLWSAFGKYDSQRTFSTWMYRIALNVAIDFKRRQKRWGRITISDSSYASQSATSRDQDDFMEQSRDLKELLETQSEQDRLLLLLHLENHSHREIGEILGISETNVGTRLNRLKTSLIQLAGE